MPKANGHVFNDQIDAFSLPCCDLPEAFLVARVISGVERTGDDKKKMSLSLQYTFKYIYVTPF